MAESKTITIEKLFQPEGNKPYGVVDEDGDRYATFKAEIGDTLVRGQRGVVEYTTVQKDGYTNNYIESWSPIQTLDSEIGKHLMNGTEPPNYRQPTHPGDQASMRRALALQRAHEFLPYVDDPTLTKILALAEKELEWLEAADS